MLWLQKITSLFFSYIHEKVGETAYYLSRDWSFFSYIPALIISYMIRLQYGTYGFVFWSIAIDDISIILLDNPISVIIIG